MYIHRKQWLYIHGMDSQKEILDTICLQRLCPNCNSQQLSYLVYENDNEIYFECIDCNWELTTQIDLVRDAGFYPLQGEIP